MFERQVTCLVPGRTMETYHGHVRTPADAIILFEACRIGLLPRVQRRLSEKERASINSGSVFVWDEREAGMRRWTDGKSWSASRVSGSFLTYREMEGKRGGCATSAPLPGTAVSKKAARTTGDKASDHDSPEDSPDGYRYKADVLMKQSFSISTSAGQHLHLISYYSRNLTANSHNLPTPSQDPRLRQIRPEKGMYPEASLQDHNAVPPLARGPMGSPHYTGGGHMSSSRASPLQSIDRGSPYRLPATYSSYLQQPSAEASPYATWVPPSPLHTPSRSPHRSSFTQPSWSLHQAHDSRTRPDSRHGQAHLTAFDRLPAPLSDTNMPPVPSPSTAAKYPYYDSTPTSRQHTYPLPPSYISSHERELSYESKHGYGHPVSEYRHDSIYTNGRERNVTTPPLPASTPRQRTNTPPGKAGQTIPSISSLIHVISNSPPPGHRPAPSAHNSTSAVPTRSLGEMPTLHSGLLNPDTSALQKLDKVTFRI